VTGNDATPSRVEVPRAARTIANGPADRPHVDARAAVWLLAQRTRIRELELEAARLGGALATADRVERGVQRFCDRLEAELECSRKREATLARALGYAEAERDGLARRPLARRGDPDHRVDQHASRPSRGPSQTRH